MREPREYENPLCAEIGGDFWFPDKDKESVVTLKVSMQSQSVNVVLIEPNVLSGESTRNSSAYGVGLHHVNVLQ